MDKGVCVAALVRVVPGGQFTVTAGDLTAAGVSFEFKGTQGHGLFIDTGKALPEVIKYFFHICLGGFIIVVPVKGIHVSCIQPSIAELFDI